MWSKLKNIEIENVIMRLLTTWLGISSINLLKDGYFYEVSFLQATNYLFYLILFILLFISYTVLDKLVKKINVCSLLMLVNYTICSVFWLKDVNNIFFIISNLIFFSLIVINFFNKNENILKKIKLNNIIYKILLFMIILLPLIVISIIGILRYYDFSAPNFDFGIFSHIFYNLKETFLPLSTCERDMILSHFAVHFSPILYLLLPIYYLFSHPITLQIGQVLLLFSGVIPVIKLCRHFNFSKNKLLIIILLYSFYPAISLGTLYDFHENAFLLPLLLWLFYFFETSKKIPLYIFLVLVLLVKEDAFIYILIYSLYMIISRKKYFHGIMFLAISIMYYLIVSYFMSRYGLGVMSDRFANLTYNDGGLFSAIKTIIINPGYVLTQTLSLDKLSYLLKLLLPICFLPFISKKFSRLILLLPILINIITDYVYLYDISFHYNFSVTAFLFYVSILNLNDFDIKFATKILSLSVCFCLIFYYSYLTPNLTNYINEWKKNKSDYIYLEKTLKNIPASASVSASTFFVPHLTNRKEIYEVYYHENKLDIDYLVLDMRYEDNYETINYYLNNGYELMVEKDNLIKILKKKELTKS